MEYRIFLYLAPLLLFSVGSLLYVVWRRREYPPAVFLFVFVLAVFGGLLANVMEFVGGGEAWILSWSRIEHIFVSLIPPGWLLFVFEFTGRQEWRRPRRFWPFCLPAALNIGLVFTNDLHHLFWKEFRFLTVAGLRVMRISYGIPFYLVYALHYLLLALGVLIVLREFLRSHDLYRRQLFWIFLGISVAVAFNLVYVLRLLPWLRKDYSPVGYALGSLALAVGIFRHRFLQLLPVPRTRLFDYLGEGLVVTDAHDRVVDMNRVARQLPGLEGYQPGLPVHQLKLLVPLFEAQPVGQEPARRDVELAVGGEPRHYELTLNRLFGPRRRYRGAVVVIYDITQRVRLFAELKTLRGIVPICAKCKKVRTDKGFWQQVESYVAEHSYAEFSHGLCPTCLQEYYKEAGKP